MAGEVVTRESPSSQAVMRDEYVRSTKRTGSGKRKAKKRRRSAIARAMARG